MHPTQKPAENSLQELTGTPADTLRVAAGYLDEHGWTRCRFFDNDEEPQPAACLVGAVRYAVYGYPNAELSLDRPLGHHVDKALYVLAGFLGVDVLDGLEPWLDCTADAVQAWNDRPGRTAEQVTQAMREAADVYECETYGQHTLDHDRIPTPGGFAAWHQARTAPNDADANHIGGAA